MVVVVSEFFYHLIDHVAMKHLENAVVAVVNDFFFHFLVALQ